MQSKCVKSDVLLDPVRSMDADGRRRHFADELWRVRVRMAGGPAIDQLAERHPCESAGKRCKPLFAAFKIDAVPELTDGVEALHVGLAGIDFPWMQIEDVGAP